MDITLLSNVRPGVFSYTICVRISRMWEFHGKNDDEGIKHLDLVVVDEKGTPMYVEVPPDAIPKLKPHLQEQKIVYMKKIIIDRAKKFYKPVRSSYMIKLNIRTELIDVEHEPRDFPKYTFLLTPFHQLSKFQGNNEYFLDVIGRITAISDPTQSITNNGMVRTKRLIHLMDLSGNKIEISLWGPRAEEFEGEQVYSIGQDNHVIAIFVGTSLKSYSGCTPFLSGTSACRWYINLAEIPEITTFYRSLPSQIQKIQKLHLLNADHNHNKIEQKTLLELQSIDPFEETTKRFKCTITITKIAEDQSWCYPACPRCNSFTKYEGNNYICKKEDIPCPKIIHRYKLCITATDGTCELPFMLFNERATTLLGKTAEKLLKDYSRFDTPPEIKQLVGEKITVIVKVMPDKSVAKPNKEPVFDILNIKRRHSKDHIDSAFRKEKNIDAFGTTYSDSMDLPALVPIQSQKLEKQVFSEQFSPQDIQLMEIDQTSFLHELSVAPKRTLEEDNYLDKDFSAAPSVKRGKRNS